jgi:hypothetical protein
MRIILELLNMARIRGGSVDSSRRGEDVCVGLLLSTPPESTQSLSSPLLRISDVDHCIRSVNISMIIFQFYSLYFDLCSKIFLTIIAIFFKKLQDVQTLIMKGYSACALSSLYGPYSC